MAKEFYKVKEIAEVMGMTVQSVARQCRIGEIDAVTIGGQWLIKKDPIDRKLQRGKYATEDQGAAA